MKSDSISDAQDHITEEAVDNTSTNLVEAGSVLVVARSGILQHTLPVAVTRRQVALNQDLKAVKPRKEVDPEYLRLALKAFEQTILHTCTKTGTTVQSLEMPAFLRFEVPLAPRAEQRRIVAEIEKQFTRLDAGVAALRRVQANLKRYRAAVLKAACEGRLVPTEATLARQEGRTFETGPQLLQRIIAERRKNWNGRGIYREPVAPDHSNLPAIPEGWAWANVAQLSFVDVGFAFKSADFSESGVRLLRGENLEPGRMRWSETRFWPETKLDEFRHLLVREGEIILAMDRPLVSAGLKIARARPNDLPCLLVQRMARFRPVLEPMTTFLFTALNTQNFIKHLVGAQTGTQLPHISSNGIQSFPVPLPPIAEQTRIVAELERRLSVAEELEALVSTNLKRANRLRHSILTISFTPQKALALHHHGSRPK